MSLVLDTHAVVWYLSNSDQLPLSARTAIEAAVGAASDIFLSAISLIEIIYLSEKGRLAPGALPRLQDALKDPISGLVVVPVDRAVAEAVSQISRSRVPDMPDRIIGATAVHLRVPLVTRDRRLREAGISTIW
jgi:PIN domain nuclease of toxin-antitoxin system